MPNVVKKNKVVLSDYNYLRDIENRLLMSELSTFEVNVLQEILHSSITFSIKSLADNLGVKESKIIPLLEKFSKVKLLKISKDQVTLDKEMRKYYEFQMEKFDDYFRPNIEFILSSLSTVPIHVLPIWYSLPRTADNIYASLIEKNLLTPKIYERYLSELEFDNPVIEQIFKDVFTSPNLYVKASDLYEKYELTREQFEKYMLLLEYNFVCYLSYKQVNGMWVEVVSPFYEWVEYMTFEKESQVVPIKEKAKIQQLRQGNFVFLQDMNSILQLVPVELEGGNFSSKVLNLLTNGSIKKNKPLELYFKKVLNKILDLGLAESVRNTLQITESGKSWLKKTPEDRSILLYRHPRNLMAHSEKDPNLYSERNIREIEKSLKRVAHSGWVYFGDFLKGFTVPIGNHEPVTLKKKGKSWKYMVPLYTDEEKVLIFETIFERMFEVGIVSIGIHDDKPCFCVSPFGRASFGE